MRYLDSKVAQPVKYPQNLKKLTLDVVKTRKVLNLHANTLNEIKEEPKPEEKEKSSQPGTFSFIADIGFSISLPMIGGVFLGSFLDKKFSTAPKITLSLLFLGLMIGISNMYFLIKKITKP